MHVRISVWILFLPALGGYVTSLSAMTMRTAEAIPPQTEILKALRTGHPRLLVPAGGFAAVRTAVEKNPQTTQWLQKLKQEADKILTEPVSTYSKPDGIRLLHVSRLVLKRTYTLSMVYRLDGDAKYAARAWKEFSAAAAFPDWNPSHFLDVAEMTHAFAIGYDWLYDVWTLPQKDLLRNAIRDKGLQPGLKEFSNNAFWVKATHNWNTVCNGGLALGALAIGDEESEQARSILHKALTSMHSAGAIEEFAPDGGWGEGPGYWTYATHYLAVCLAGLESALGTTYGMAQTSGLSEAGSFPIYMTGPLGKTFNYADGGDGTVRAPWMFWFARVYDKPIYAWYQRQVATPHALDLLWFDGRGTSPSSSNLPLDKHFRGVDALSFRSAWEDNQALFVGFKGGDNKTNHSHLDLGSFVMDALGVRWAVELGSENYNLPGYWETGGKRWVYYRLRAEGNNTLVIGPDDKPDQDPRAAAKILKFHSGSETAFALADLSAAYARSARKVMRGVALLSDRSRVLIQDEMQTLKPADVWWFMHTKAQVQIQAGGVEAMLSQDGKRLWARILSPAGAKFSLEEAKPLPLSPNPSGQNKNEGVRKLAIKIQQASDVRLAVLLVPLAGDQSPPVDLPIVVPLEGRWPIPITSSQRSSLGKPDRARSSQPGISHAGSVVDLNGRDIGIDGSFDVE